MCLVTSAQVPCICPPHISQTTLPWLALSQNPFCLSDVLPSILLFPIGCRLCLLVGVAAIQYTRCSLYRRDLDLTLAKVISKHPSIDPVLWFTLLESIVTQHTKLRKGIYKRTKRAPRSGILCSRMFSGIKKEVTSGKDPTQPSFHLGKRNSRTV